VEAHITSAPLYIANIRPVQANSLRKRLLTVSTASAQISDCLAQASPQLSILHDRSRALMYTISLQTMSYTEVPEHEEQTTRTTRSTIRNLEQGHWPARLYTIRKLAGALGVEPRELMKGDNDG
jgi:hypothetical protein